MQMAEQRRVYCSNVSGKSNRASARYMVDHHAMPHSRLLTFTDGSDDVRVRCYMHTSEHRPQGWYAEKETTIRLSRPFRIDG